MTDSSSQPGEASGTALPAAEFKRELTAVIPHLRAYSRSIVVNHNEADDLVQDALTKAWAARKRFKAGTSMRAWTFVILKNTYLSSLRRKKFTGDYDEAKAEIALVTPPEQEDQLHLADLRRAMAELPVDQREALILVGAEGFSYEEAAEIADCAIGTMKSRVSRARARLEDIFASGNLRVGHAEAEEATGALDKLLDTPDEVEP